MSDTDIGSVQVSNAKLTVLDLVEIGQLQNIVTKGAATVSLLVRRTSLTIDEVFGLDMVQASALINRVCDALEEADKVQKMSFLWDRTGDPEGGDSEDNARQQD